MFIGEGDELRILYTKNVTVFHNKLNCSPILFLSVFNQYVLYCSAYTKHLNNTIYSVRALYEFSILYENVQIFNLINRQIQ
jgi:hypothetical protein